MPSKDPYVVLGVEPGASPDEVKAAWRTLARRHHPDLTGDDPDIARRATRRMAEINAAYAALTRDDAASRRIRRQAEENRHRQSGAVPPGGTAPGGPPAPPPTRPVTGRVDTSATFQPRNQVTTPPGTRLPLTGQPPQRHDRSATELRASQPSSPAQWDRVTQHPRREPPALDEALQLGVDFGKFHGHTLGEIAAFEPSYIDWLATMMTRDPDVAAAARVIAAELDRRGVRRTHRPVRSGWQSNPFR